MKKTLVGIALAAAVTGLAAVPANADILYISSDGTVHNISSNVMMPAAVETHILTRPAVIETQVLTQPAVVEPMVITQPAVVAPTVTTPVYIDDDRGLFNLRLWPLLDFSLF